MIPEKDPEREQTYVVNVKNGNNNDTNLISKFKKFLP